MRAAKIQHLLGFGDAANWRTGEASTSEYKAEGSDGERLFRRADEGDVAIAAEQVDVGVDVVIGADRGENEIEAAGVLLHFVAVAGADDFVGPGPRRLRRR